MTENGVGAAGKQEGGWHRRWVPVGLALEHKLVCRQPQCFADLPGVRALVVRLTEREHQVRLVGLSGRALQVRLRQSPPTQLQFWFPAPQISVACRCDRDLNLCVPQLLTPLCRAFNQTDLVQKEAQRQVAAANVWR